MACNTLSWFNFKVKLNGFKAYFVKHSLKQ